MDFVSQLSDGEEIPDAQKGHHHSKDKAWDLGIKDGKTDVVRDAVEAEGYAEEGEGPRDEIQHDDCALLICFNVNLTYKRLMPELRVAVHNRSRSS